MPVEFPVNINQQNALEEQDSDFAPLTVPVSTYKDPNKLSYKDEFTKIDSSYIQNNEKITTEDMISEQPINDSIREYLKLSGLGAYAFQLDPVELVDQYKTRMRNYDTDVGLFDEGLALARSKPEHYNSFKNAHDIWSKYPSVFQKRGEGVLGNLAATRENVLNQLNPFESPTNWIPGVLFYKWGAKGGLSVGQKVAGSTFLDMLASFGLDAYDQDLQKRIKRQEGYNIYQGYMSLLQGMIGGGLELAMETKAMNPLKLFDGVETLFTKKPKSDKQKAAIIKSMNNKVEDLTEYWIKSTNNGKELLEKSNTYAADDFMELMLFGNSEKNVKGLLTHMVNDLDLVYYKDVLSAPEGQFMASLTSALDEGLSPQVKTAITKKLRALKDVPSIDLIFNKIPDAKNPDSFKFFLDAINSKFSKAGETLNIANRVKQQVQTVNDVLKDQAKAESKLKKLEKKFPQPLRYFQQSWKRGIVSTWSTTSLNMAGWTAANLANLAGDSTHLLAHVALMPLNLAVDVISYSRGGIQKSQLLESYKSAKNIVANNTYRFATLLEPNATIDAFYELMKIDPKVAKQLRQVIVGGVDVKSVDELAKKFNYTKVHPDGHIIGAPPGWMKGNEKYLNFVQKMGLVQVADLFTKSQSYLGNIDRLLRDRKGYGLSEFLQKDEETIKSMLASQELFEINGLASEQTLKEIFSKSYKTKDSGVPSFLTETAKYIEDIGDIPVLGTLFPFGKFFNNSVAFTYNNLIGGNVRYMAEMIKAGGNLNAVDRQIVKDSMKTIGTGGSIGLTGAALGTDILASDTQEEDPLMLKLLKGATKYTALGMCVAHDKEKIKKGLDWDVEIINGRQRSVRYMFPYSQCAVLARYYNLRNERNINPITNEESTRVDLTDELMKDITEQLTISQIGRNLSGVFTFDNIAKKVLNNENETVEELITRAITSSVSNIPGMYTRPLGDTIEKLSPYYLGENSEKLAVADKNSFEASVYNATRYLTNFQRLLFGDATVSMYLEPKKSALREDKQYSSGGWFDILGLKTRDAPTFTLQVLQEAQMQPWTKEFRSKFPEADNYFRSEIAPILEYHSYQLLKQPNWKNLSPEDKKFKFQKVFTDVKKEVLNNIKNGLVLSEQGMIEDGKSKFPDEGNAAYLQRLSHIIDIAELNERDLVETLQLYNSRIGRKYFNTRLNPRELLEEDSFVLREIIKLSKEIKQARK